MTSPVLTRQELVAMAVTRGGRRMNAYKIALLAWLALSALLIVLGVGKPRTPTTPGLAAASVVAVGVLAALVVLA